LAHSFLDKFAAKSCKRFPSHLNNISTVYTTLSVASLPICARQGRWWTFWASSPTFVICC